MLSHDRPDPVEVSNVIKRRIKTLGDEIKPETPLDQYLTRYACIQLLRDLHAELLPTIPAPASPASCTLWAAHNPTAPGPCDSRPAVHGYRNHGPIPFPTAELPDALRKAAAAPGEWDLRPLLLDAASHLEERGSQLANWESFDDQLTEAAQDFGTPWEELEPGERLDGIRAKAEELTALSAGIGGIAKLLGIEPDADTPALELATHLQEVVKERLVHVAGKSSSPAGGSSSDSAVAVARILGMIEARRGAIRTSSALDALYGLQDEIGREFKAPPIADNPGPQFGRLAFDLLKHLDRQRAFSLRAFGPSYHWSRIVAHVREELAEIEADPEDWMEWIDIILLGFDALLRTDMSGEEICSALMRKQEENEARTWPDWRTTPTDATIEHVRPSASGTYIKDIEANLIKASVTRTSKSVGDVRNLPEAMRAASGASPEGWHRPTLLRQGADELAAHMEFRRRVMREIERVAGLVGVPPRPDALAMLEGIAVALVQPPPCLPDKIVAAGKRLGVDTADAPEAVLDRIEAVAGVGQKLGTAPGFIRVTTRDGWEEVVRIEDVRGYRSNADGFALNIANIGVVALSESSGCQVADVFAPWTRDLTDGEI